MLTSKILELSISTFSSEPSRKIDISSNLSIFSSASLYASFRNWSISFSISLAIGQYH